MEIRGNRRCQSCGTEWSYYATGEVSCPDCGSLKSVGTDETRTLHTDTSSPLELEPFRQRVADEPVDHYADELKSALRTYTQKRGFINDGALRDLDETYVAARELIHAIDILSRERSPTEGERLYLLSLFESVAAATPPAESDTVTAEEPEGSSNSRPADSDIPTRLQPARTLAVADSVTAYRRDLRTWLNSYPDPDARQTLGRLREQCKRIAALQGDVSIALATTLLESAREIGRYLRTDDPNALATARDRLQRV